MNPRVRLTPREQLALREAFQAALPSDASVYLHGSGGDRNARGGDIDLLVHVPGLKDTEELPLAARLATEVERAIG